MSIYQQTADFISASGMRRMTILVCISTAAVLLLWDLLCCLYDQTSASPTISHVLRRANSMSGGLLALSLLAVWIHLFLIQYLPQSWQEM